MPSDRGALFRLQKISGSPLMPSLEVDCTGESESELPLQLMKKTRVKDKKISDNIFERIIKILLLNKIKQDDIYYQ
jgi:hypothetical protein